MTPMHLTRIDPEANMRRFYRLSVQPGLFGDVSLVREWGRIGTSGQCKVDWFEGEADAAHASEKLAAQKRRRAKAVDALSQGNLPGRDCATLTRGPRPPLGGISDSGSEGRVQRPAT